MAGLIALGGGDIADGILARFVGLQARKVPSNHPIKLAVVSDAHGLSARR